MFYPSCGEHVDHYNAKAVCCCSDLKLVTPTLFVFFVVKWNIQPTDTVYPYFIEHELGIHIFEAQLPWCQWPNIKLLLRGLLPASHFIFTRFTRYQYNIVESGVNHHNQPLYIISYLFSVIVSIFLIYSTESDLISGQDIFFIKLGDS